MSNRCPVCGYINPDGAGFCVKCHQGLLPALNEETAGKRGKAVIVSLAGRTVLSYEEVTIGRDPGNKLVLKDPKVSRRHAVVRRRADSYEILDLGSSNGTFVNEQRLGSTTKPLNEGDTIRVGDTLFTFEYEAPQTGESTIYPPTTMAPPPPRWENTGAMAVPPLIPGAAPPPRWDVLPVSSAAPPPAFMVPSPAAAAPPPAVFKSWGVVFLAIPAAIVLVTVILSLVVKATPGGYARPTSSFGNALLFVLQMLLLTAVICLIPTLASWIVRRGGYAALVTVESAAFVAAFVGFGFWLFGEAGLGTWILYAAALVLLIEAGSRFVLWRKDTTLKRLKGGAQFRSIQPDAEAIEKMARYEVVLYIPVPIGLLLGTIIGLLRGLVALQIVELCVQLVLALSALVLLFFLIVGFARMADPLFKTIPVATPEIAKPGRKRKKAAQPPQGQDQQYINLACDVSALRTVYKYDALHNAILLVAFVLVTLKIWLVPIGLPWLIISLLLATLAFSEIPYAIGQYLLHNRILEQYTGGKYADMSKTLQEKAPVFPPLPFLAALLTSGTAGGILYALLSQIAQNSLTTLFK